MSCNASTISYSTVLHGFIPTARVNREYRVKVFEPTEIHPRCRTENTTYSNLFFIDLVGDPDGGNCGPLSQSVLTCNVIIENLKGGIHLHVYIVILRVKRRR